MQTAERPVLWMVIPCYEESDYGKGCLRITATEFLEELNLLISSGRVSPESSICFVDDGSKDDTWEVIQQLSAEDPHFRGISLSRNRGHQNALLAGLMESLGKCNITISIDCDGQDDISAMTRMVDEYLSGSEVVYGVRAKRDTDTAFKRGTAQAFYKLMGSMGVETVYNHADYRLLSSKVLAELAKYGEVNLFLRGMVPLVGFKSSTVEYDRAERVAGESHYPLSKMVGLAVDGITSLSAKPLRIASGLGILFSLAGFFGIIFALISVARGDVVAGWASTICAIGLIGGIQLLCLGVIGEYVGKVYLETKHRPRYSIGDRTWDHGGRRVWSCRGE